MIPKYRRLTTPVGGLAVHLGRGVCVVCRSSRAGRRGTRPRAARTGSTIRSRSNSECTTYWSAIRNSRGATRFTYLLNSANRSSAVSSDSWNSMTTLAPRRRAARPARGTSAAPCRSTTAGPRRRASRARRNRSAPSRLGQPEPVDAVVRAHAVGQRDRADVGADPVLARVEEPRQQPAHQHRRHLGVGRERADQPERVVGDPAEEPGPGADDADPSPVRHLRRG